ncbi:Histone deacetylase complex subunit [Apiospora kogelbergensis]|uniref:Histone deacetylase complex subunit n=1 Tax=Apiospora kogelbergensis TaxID=1337665 RepID=A0AAW0QD95_9PEZI
MEHRDKPPFALQLFYRTGAFHRPDEFSAHRLPPHLTVHTWDDCTLLELAHHLAASPRFLLPEPAIGTRLVFRLIFADTRSANPSVHHFSSWDGGGKFMVKELGSLVIGDGGPGLDPEDPELAKQIDPDTDANKTLADARFVVGDYISVAILPSLEDGTVAPTSSARMGRGAGAGEAGRVRDRFTGMASGPGGHRHRENGFGGGGRLGRIRGRGGGPGGSDGFGRGGVPMGEWRRGERLPDASSTGRGRGRGHF